MATPEYCSASGYWVGASLGASAISMSAASRSLAARSDSKSRFSSAEGTADGTGFEVRRSRSIAVFRSFMALV